MHLLNGFLIMQAHLDLTIYTKRMGNSKKRNISRITLLVCIVVIAFCIVKMVPDGMAGNTSKVIGYFIPIIPAFLIGVVAGIAQYYYRDKSDYGASQRASAEVRALAEAGRKTDEK